jgi:GTP cyclohydrolase I
MNQQRLESIAGDLLTELKPKWQQDPDMKDTPKRISHMLMHFFRNEEVELHFEKRFPTTNKQMVIVKDIECFGLCPHHLLPIVYKVHVGYIPDGWAIGLSKLARIAIALSSFPKLQENFTTEIADTLEKHLHPRGVMVVVNGLHGCMRCRGVEQDSSTVTSEVRGIYEKDRISTQEFIEYIKLSS